MTTSQEFWANRQVALTGATGFVGSHLAMRLLAQGANVQALVRPRSNYRQLADIGIRCIEGCLEDTGSLARTCAGCEFLFHVAGTVNFENDLEPLRRTNVEGTKNVIEAARSAGVRRLVYTSSVVAVGASTRPMVLDESAPGELASLRIPYVNTKRMAEQIALEQSSPDLEVVVVNPSCVVGPDDFSNSEFGTLCRRFWRGRIPFHFGGGLNCVDVRDVAQGHLLAAESGRAGERYILGGTNRACGAFFADLARIAGRPIFRLRLPNAAASTIATLHDRLRSAGKSRAYLTIGQAKLNALFFYVTSAKAQREFGYRSRSLGDSLRDTHAFRTKKRCA